MMPLSGFVMYIAITLSEFSVLVSFSSKMT